MTNTLRSNERQSLHGNPQDVGQSFGALPPNHEDQNSYDLRRNLDASVPTTEPVRHEKILWFKESPAPFLTTYAVSRATLIRTGAEIVFLTSSRFWDLERLRRTEGLNLTVYKDSKGFKSVKWESQPEDTKRESLARMESAPPRPIPHLKRPEAIREATAASPKSLVSSYEMHPAIPLATELIAAVRREANNSGLIGCGYFFIPNAAVLEEGGSENG